MEAGLETDTSGTKSIGCRVVNGVEPIDRDIAMAVQNYVLYPHKSIEENMGYGLNTAKVPRDEIRDRVAEAAKMLRLEPYLKRWPRDLSGGQHQRVAMGRAIVCRPKVSLFDKPLSNLDARCACRCGLKRKELQARLGVTALCVTHDRVEAVTLADRLIVMNAGSADQIGVLPKVYTNPQSELVAGYIGSPEANFLPASVVAAGTVPRETTRVDVRPEHTRPVPKGQGRLQGNVAHTEALGAETLAHLRPCGDDALFKIRQDGMLDLPHPGQACGIE